MEAVAGALFVATVLLAILAIDLLRAHGELVRSLDTLDPLEASMTVPVEFTNKSIEAEEANLLSDVERTSNLHEESPPLL
ncbi:MAG: hypothetical protein WCL38_05425 [Actinomycetota bacterium]